MSNKVEKPEYEYIKKDGRVIRNYRGQEILLANFNDEDGHCEFVSDEMDTKHREGVQQAIEQDPLTGESSKLKIVSYGIAGRERDTKNAKEPERPKENLNLGDKTPALVNWFFKYRPQEAYVRYGVELGKDGRPIIRHCRRIEIRPVDNAGKEGQVEEREFITDNKEGIVARRQTNRTFLRSEVVEEETPVETEV